MDINRLFDTAASLRSWAFGPQKEIMLSAAALLEECAGELSDDAAALITLDDELTAAERSANLAPTARVTPQSTTNSIPAVETPPAVAPPLVDSTTGEVVAPLSPAAGLVNTSKLPVSDGSSPVPPSNPDQLNADVNPPPVDNGDGHIVAAEKPEDEQKAVGEGQTITADTPADANGKPLIASNAAPVPDQEGVGPLAGAKLVDDPSIPDGASVPPLAGGSAQTPIAQSSAPQTTPAPVINTDLPGEHHY